MKLTRPRCDPSNDNCSTQLIRDINLTHRIHGTGIYTYMKTIKINHSWIGKYTVRPMGPSWVTSPTRSSECLEFVRP